MLLVTESGTRLPESMYDFASLASSVSSLMFLRKISPVEIAGIFSASAILTAWVPHLHGRADDEQTVHRSSPS